MMCRPGAPYPSTVMMTRKEYADSLRRLAEDFRNYCPEATVSLRNEAQKFDYDPSFGEAKWIRKPREWKGYVSINGDFITTTDKSYQITTVREVIE